MKKGALTVLTWILLAGCAEKLDSADSTRARMTETFVRINLYAERVKSAPTGLEDLPVEDGFSNQTTDGWNRPLQFQMSDDGVITLTSLGADGKPGGTGENADIIMRYRSLRPDGSLWADSPLWIAEAQVK